MGSKKSGMRKWDGYCLSAGHMYGVNCMMLISKRREFDLSGR